MPIREVSPFSAIFDDEDHDDDPAVCDICLSVGVHSVLGPRIYGPGENDEDSDNWLQCYTCGRPYPKFEVRGQNKIRGFKEPETNPFGNKQQFASAFQVKQNYQPSYNLRKIKVSKLYEGEDKEINSFKEKGAIVNE